MHIEFGLDRPSDDIRSARTPRYDVVIIGGGYAGTVTAIHMLRRMQAPLRMAIIEPRARLGRGVAYDTPLACHLLNTRAKRMSLRPDDEQHYTRWAQRRAAAEGYSNVDENSFTPRGWFGDYVEQELKTTIAQRGGGLVHLRRTALYCEQAGGRHWRVGLSGGRSVSAPRVVLALGNLPRRSGGLPGLKSADARVLHAWDLNAYGTPSDSDILIVGTGLTMIDAVLTLDHRDHHGTIHAVSRHGLMPLMHTEKHGRVEPLAGTCLRQLMRELRCRIKEVESRGEPWQWSMDGARHQAQALWRELPISERRRFLRHVRSYWDVHRHRFAPQIAQRLQQLIQGGHLIIHQGRIGEIAATATSLRVLMRSPTGTRELQVQQIINGLGFELDAHRTDSPLLQNLLRTGVALPGLAGLGIRTDELGRLQAASGRTWPSLYTLGSLRAGDLWETTAAYEIQNQAVALAEHLARQQSWYPISV
jgi:uncharacterized NAD(P)/FAD-binding protein YdhS